MVWLWPCLVTSPSNLHMQSWGENICNSKHWGSKQTNSLHFRYSWKTAPALRLGFWDAHIVSSNGIQRRLWVESVELRSRILIHPLTALTRALQPLGTSGVQKLRCQSLKPPTVSSAMRSTWKEHGESQRCGIMRHHVLSFLPQVWAGVPGNSCFFLFSPIFPPKIDHKGLTEALPLYQTKKVVSENVNRTEVGASAICASSLRQPASWGLAMLKSMDLLHQGGMKIHLTSYCYALWCHIFWGWTFSCTGYVNRRKKSGFWHSHPRIILS